MPLLFLSHVLYSTFINWLIFKGEEFDWFSGISQSTLGNIVKRGTHLTFNAVRVLNNNVLTFCLHMVLIKCSVSISKSFI